VFVVPWIPDGHGGFLFTYIGTTDTDYDGSLEDPQCSAQDIEYLLRAVNASLVEPLGAHDVLATWAGLRPLVKDASSSRTADLSRRHRVTVSGNGLVTVTGGKLTTYRQMAEDTVHEVVELLGGAVPRGARRARTRHLALRGAAGWQAAAERSEHLGRRYGGEARVVEAMVARDADLGGALVEGLPYLRAEALMAVRHEMALSLDDVLARRTRARLQALDATARAAHEVAALIGPELGWSPQQATAQAEAYAATLTAERPNPGSPELHLPEPSSPLPSGQG
jgi:glycerol-3-phosphate dehydrogenase